MTLHRFWVFIEQQNSIAHPVSWELLGVAKDLANQLKNYFGAGFA